MLLQVLLFRFLNCGILVGLIAYVFRKYFFDGIREEYLAKRAHFKQLILRVYELQRKRDERSPVR